MVHDAAAALAVRRAPLALLAVLFALGGLSGCGGGSSAKPAGVAWEGKPVVVRQPELPDDTIVSGQIRNRTGHVLKLDARDVRLLTRGGHAVQSTARFSTGVTHQLYPPRDAPKEGEPDFLRERLGEVATVKPGEAVPLVVSWRVAHGQPQPVRVDLGDGVRVTLPPEAGPGT